MQMCPSDKDFKPIRRARPDNSAKSGKVSSSIAANASSSIRARDFSFTSLLKRIPESRWHSPPNDRAISLAGRLKP
jgi:hypothetical protein